MEDIPLDLIRDNPFNSRKIYEEYEIESLADSISKVGLLTPVKVRQKGLGFEMVYGHRRVQAARLLNWKSIQATVGSFSDDELLQFSLIENLERKNLSDYEKALSFKRMHEEFGKTEEEIGQLVGLSKGAVSNYLSMARMFDEETLALDPSLRKALHSITEHHARYLNRIEDATTRANTLRLVVSEDLSVRDLERITQHLKSWFRPEERFPLAPQEMEGGNGPRYSTGESSDLLEIQEALVSEFIPPRRGDFPRFANLYAFDWGYSLYSAFPPFQLVDGSRAVAKEKHWFFSVAPHFSATTRDVRIQIFGDAALATLYVDYDGKLRGRPVKKVTRGSVFFVKRGRVWKIVHEHWSDLRK